MGSLLRAGGGSQELVTVLRLVTVWGAVAGFWGQLLLLGWFWLVFSSSPTKAPLSPSDRGVSQAEPGLGLV